MTATRMTATRMLVRDRIRPTGHGIPPTRVPGRTFRQPDHRQDKTFENPVGAQGFDCVLATGGCEPAGRQPQGRHICPVQLDQKDKDSRRQGTDGRPRGRRRGIGTRHRGSRLVECAFHAKLLMRKKIQSGETCTKLLVQIPATCSRGSRKSPNHHIGGGWNSTHQVDADMTKPACDSMSNHRRPDSLTHNQSKSWTAATHQLICLSTVECVDNQIASSHPATASYSQRKV